MNEFLTHFHFLRPWWLLGIVPAVLVFITLLMHQRRNTQWQKIIDEKLLPYLMDEQLSTNKRLPLYGILAAWMLGCLALAGPTWQKIAQPVQKELSALMVLWDLSPSMEAKDVTPSRLTRSRLKLIDLLNAREEGLTGLIVYSGDAHMVTPLTDDTRTIISQLSGLSPSMMPSQGSRLEAALEMAKQAFTDAGVAKGEIVILTDGIAEEAIGNLKDLSRGMPHGVTVWGIGTPQGAPIPLANGDFARNSSGEIVIAQLAEEQLSDAAIAMGGVYVPFSNDELDIRTILNFGINVASNTSMQKNRLFDQWYEQGHWIALLLLPFAALAFRRGWLLCLVFFTSFGHSPQTQALSWQDLWLTDDQQAKQHLDKAPEKAAELFNDEDWRAAAHYKSGAYEKAETHYAQGETVKDLYNYANSLTQQGQYDKAIAAYNKALQQQPNFTEAEENKAIAEKLKQLAQMAQQQNQNGQQNQDQQQQSQNQQSQNGQQQNQQQDQQSQEQQNSEQQQAQNQQEQQSSEQQSQQQAGEQQDAQQDDNQQQQMNQDKATDEQQKAMEQQYSQGEKQEEQSEEQKQQQMQEMAQQAEPQDQDAKQQEQNKQQQIVELSPEMQEQKEAQQALEQWLRKVPDDPSGLLRNKFQYEYNQRRREMIEKQYRSPDGNNEQRW